MGGKYYLRQHSKCRFLSGGRFGFASRLWGLTLDNVVGATVVLANGTIVQASNADYPDLFWVSAPPVRTKPTY